MVKKAQSAKLKTQNDGASGGEVMGSYDHKQIEEKWQKRWEKEKVYFVDTTQPSDPPSHKATEGQGKYYCLDMLPYPSGAAMHVGHLKGYVGTDVVARFMKMKGFQVIHPMGWDSFGLPAESYALKVNRHPKELNKELVDKFKSQLNIVGFSYDWTKEVNTSDPEYIKWTQWWFLLLYKKGLAYRAEAPVNWCPGCQTVLANEQVIDGKCERCGSEVIKKNLKQWFFKITAYADRLLEDLNKLDWPESTKMGQRNWIGKKEGVKVKFMLKVPGQADKHSVEVFTTRLDTIYGVTFVVIAPELAQKWLEVGWQAPDKVKEYVAQSLAKRDLERFEEAKEKSGVFTGVYAINPVNNEQVPVWVADYVLMDYGTGVVMGVPAHDERDFEFAKRYVLPIKVVVDPDPKDKNYPTLAFDVDEVRGAGGHFKLLRKKLFSKQLSSDAFGILADSDEFSGMKSNDATEKIFIKLKKEGKVEKQVNYKLRDWLVSRQRYWGAPIPIVYCPACAEASVGEEKCGEVPLELKDLPLELPDIEDIRPKGKAPLASATGFVNTTCPRCGGPATRETDTMDGFVDNSWYYYRYLDPHNDVEFCGDLQLKHWMPVDLYVGGAEHTVGHLTYSRFFTKVLFDEGIVTFDEPFLKLRHQGLISGEDGRKMSKRWGNVVGPEEVVEKHGADSLRLYEMFMGPFGDSLPWSSRGLVGCRRFLEKVWVLYQESVLGRHSGGIRQLVETDRISKSTEVKSQGDPIVSSSSASDFAKASEDSLQDDGLLRKLHRLIKKVTEDIESLKFNTAIAEMMKFVNLAEDVGGLTVSQKRVFLKLLAPFAPHMAEELWERVSFQRFSVSAFQDKQQPKTKRRNDEGDFSRNRSSSPARNGWSVHQQEWPVADPALLIEDEMEMPVQVNGKLRFTIKLRTKDSELRTEVEKVVLRDERIKKWVVPSETAREHSTTMLRRKIKKMVFVPGRLVNVVI